MVWVPSVKFSPLAFFFDEGAKTESCGKIIVNAGKAGEILCVYSFLHVFAPSRAMNLDVGFG